MVYYSLIINLVSALPHLQQVDGWECLPQLGRDGGSTQLGMWYVLEVFPKSLYVVRLKVN
jgi:hypothetical protein